jgi:2-hydroxychromene-2-carboxylate isomerase
LTEQPVFYYDLGSPWCYLAAEQITSELSVTPEWEPVLGERFSVPDEDHDQIERLASESGIQPLRWPTAGSRDTRLAMLAATYAKRVGRAVAFSLAAFRQVFAGGRDPGLQDTVLIAAAACEMHPAALLKAVQLRSVTDGLEQANRRGLDAGLTMLPGIQIGDRIFQGEKAIEQAAGALL